LKESTHFKIDFKTSFGSAKTKRSGRETFLAV